MNALQKASNTIAKYSPEILTGLAVGGLVSTVVLSVKATPKALFLIEQAHYDKWWEENEGLTIESKPVSYDHEQARTIMMQYPPTPIADIKIVWKEYVPAMLMGAATIGCIIGAQTINHRRTAALATAYTLAETGLKEYKEKVVETIGKNKEEKIRNEITEDKLRANPINEADIADLRGEGQLMFDTLSCRYFKASMEFIQQSRNTFNERLLKEGYLSLNDWYYQIGMPEAPVYADLGWRIENGILDLHYSAHLADEKTPCIAWTYDVAPQYY